MLFFTDGDHDADASSSSQQDASSSLLGGDWIFHAIVNQIIDPFDALGVLIDDQAPAPAVVTPTQNGSFMVQSETTPALSARNGFGNTFLDYTALVNGDGGVWNINKLRFGGQASSSMEAALIETVTNSVGDFYEIMM